MNAEKVEMTIREIRIGEYAESFRSYIIQNPGMYDTPRSIRLGLGLLF
jgi:hypothetical protein